MPASISPGTKEPTKRSPTEIPIWSARTTSTTLGGMIWPRVPLAVITPGGELLGVAVAQHDGQADHAHCHDAGSDHTSGCGQQAANKDDRQSKTSAHGSEELTDGFEQVLGQARPLQNRAHENKEGHCQEHLIAHGPQRCARALRVAASSQRASALPQQWRTEPPLRLVRRLPDSPRKSRPRRPGTSGGQARRWARLPKNPIGPQRPRKRAESKGRPTPFPSACLSR